MCGQCFHLVHHKLGRCLGDGECVLDVVLAQGVNHKGKAADIAEFSRWVKQAGCDVEFVEDFIQIVIRHFVLILLQRSQNHGLDRVDPYHFVKKLR